MDNLDSILAEIENSSGLNHASKTNLENKIDELNSAANPDEVLKLWSHVEKWLHTACQKFDSDNLTKIDPLIDIISFIVTKYKGDDFSKKLTHSFLQFNESIINNVDLNILLMKNGIISISEWDKQLALFLKEPAAQ